MSRLITVTKVGVPKEVSEVTIPVDSILFIETISYYPNKTDNHSMVMGEPTFGTRIHLKGGSYSFTVQESQFAIKSLGNSTKW